MQKPSTNSVLQDISPGKIIKSTVSSTKLITPINLNLLNSHTKDSILDKDQRELDNDSSSSLLADNLFIAPSNTNTIQYKLAFLRSHPVQPSNSIHKLPFDAFRVYNKQIHNFQNNKPEIETKKRQWISYN